MSHKKIKILDIGCGTKKVPGAVGVDINTNYSADIIHDLNLFPYPFMDEEFDKIHILDTLFMLENSVKVMEEIYRICKPKGLVIVTQPYFRSVWGHVDPLVKSFGTVHSFAFYDPNDPICNRYHYSFARFTTEKIIFDNHLLSPGIIRRLLIMLANRFPRKYELYLSHLFPLDQITFHLMKL